MSNYNGHEIQDAKIPEGAILMARIDVVQYMMPDGDGDVLVGTRTDNGSGERLSMVISLGMLEMAKKVITDVGPRAEWVEDSE